jgi:hypothetical protein
MSLTSQSVLAQPSHQSSNHSPRGYFMLRRAIFPCLFALVVASGCASTKVSDRQELVTGTIARPNQIWVYDFAASAADIPGESALAGQASDAPSPTAEQIAEGRKLGADIASELVGAIRGLGMPAVQATAASIPQVNDLVIRGYLVSVQEGSAVKRVVIGFGAGGSELKSVVEGFQVTPQGLRKLGSGTVDSGGSKGPGAALGAVTFLATANPAGLIISSGMKAYGEVSGRSTIDGRATATAKEIADVLKTRFQQEGWIK